MILDMRAEDSLMYSFLCGDMRDLYNNTYKNKHKFKPKYL